MATADEVLAKFAEYDTKASKQMEDMRAAIADLQNKSKITPAHAPEVSDFKAMADYIAGRSPVFERKAPVAGTTETVATGANGGYMAPEAYADKVKRALIDYSPVINEIELVNVKAPTLKVPVESALPGSNWVGEIAAVSSTVPTMALKSVDVAQLVCKVPISRLLLETSNVENAETFTIERAGKSLSKAIGTAIVAGSGTNAPSGFITSSDLVTQNSGLAAALKTANITDLIASIPGEADANAKFYCNRKTWAKIIQTYGTDSSYVNLGLQNGLPRSFFGYPVVLCPDVPDIAANAIPLAFGDLKASYTGVQVDALEFLRDPYADASNNVVNMYFYKYFGGKLVNPSAIVGLKISA